MTDRVYTERDYDSPVARFLILSVCVPEIVINVPLEECVKTGCLLCGIHEYIASGVTNFSIYTQVESFFPKGCVSPGKSLKCSIG